MREEALPVPEKKNLVPFPRSAKKRKQLLRQAESLKLRRLTRLRSLVGWLLILSILLFAAANFTLFSLSSLRQGFQIVTNALGPESGRDGVINYPAGVASAVVDLDAKKATVELTADVADSVLMDAVKDAGYDPVDCAVL